MLPALYYLAASKINTASICDSYCASLNGAISYCKTYQNPPVCFIGNQSCKPSACTPQTTASPKPTEPSTKSPAVSEVVLPSAPTLLPTASSVLPTASSVLPTASSVLPTASSVLPTVSSVFPSTSPMTSSMSTNSTVIPESLSAGCLSTAAMPSVPLFLWTEIPQGMTTLSQWRQFYRRLLAFVRANCANIQVTRLVLRVLHPHYIPGALQVYWPPASAPLWTDLLSQLPSNIELILYPYVETAFEWNQWMGLTETSDPIQGVFAFAQLWNGFLSKQNANVRFTGITIDMEEITGNSIPSVNSAPLINSWKRQYGISEFGVSVGFDATGKVGALAGHVDAFYLQFYDFYYPVPYVDSSPKSPFILYANNPQALADYVLQRVVSAKMSTVYSTYRNQIYAMWSIQNLNANCLYPLHGVCGANWEFGGWTPSAFNEFIRIIKSRSELFGGFKAHGIFQFSFVPLNWWPNNALGI